MQPSLTYQKLGQGPPLLLLPGLLGIAENWRTVAHQLTSHYTLYLINHRNHGQSFHSNVMNYPAMAADLKRFIAEQDIVSPTLIGHSMGGKVAMQLAQTYPQALERLIVVDIAPHSYDMGHLAKILQGVQQTPLNGARRRAEVDQRLQAHVDLPIMRTYLMKNLGRNEQGELVWLSNMAVLVDSIPHLEQEIVFQVSFSKPTLFIKADQSDYIRPQDLPLIKKLFPSYQLAYIKDSPHWILHYQLVQLARTIAHFEIAEKVTGASP